MGVNQSNFLENGTIQPFQNNNNTLVQSTVKAEENEDKAHKASTTVNNTNNISRKNDEDEYHYINSLHKTDTNPFQNKPGSDSFIGQFRKIPSNASSSKFNASNQGNINNNNNNNSNNNILQVKEEDKGKIEIPSNMKMQGYQLYQSLEPKQEEFIKKVLVSNNLVPEFDNETLEEFAIGFYCVEFEEQKQIFKEGEEAQMFYIIESGKVKISSEHGECKELTAENYFGYEAFEDCSYRIENATTLEITKLLCCSGQFYRQALNYNYLKELEEKVELLKKIILFKHMDNTKLYTLSRQLVPISYKANSIVVNENEQNDRVYIIHKGVIRVTRKFKKIKKLNEANFFCFIGLFIKVPCYYTYSVESNECELYEVSYKIIKEIGIKGIIHNIFYNSIRNSARMSNIFIQNYDAFFNIFKLHYYEKNDVVFEKDASKNKKLCIIISGTIRKQNKNEILAKSEDVYGDVIIDSKENQDADIISDEESLVLEASWSEIIKSSENDKNNNIDLCETVQKLKRVQIFSSLTETQFLELSKLVSKETYKEAEIISYEGKIADKFYIIKNGKVKLYQKKKYIRELEQGGCFGEIIGITGEIKLFTVIAMKYTECYVITKEDFMVLDQGLIAQIKSLSYLNDVNVSLSDLFFVKVLGNGRFGKVFLVHNTHHFYAVKFAKIKNICINKNLMQYYYNEKTIMFQIDHPFILKLVKTLKNGEYLFFLLEYIDGVTLKTYIDKRKKRNTKNPFEAAFYGGILLIVINYLHNKKILHRDIKPDNCMIDKTGYLKVIDFGVAKELKDKDTTSTLCGTPHYLAPEVITGKGYSFNADYWSLGVTMFEIFYGYLPFGQSAKDVVTVYYEVLNKKLSLPYDPKFNEINSLFKILLSKNLMHRVCNFQLLRSHPFFQEFDFEQLLAFSIKAPYIPESFIETNAKNNISVSSQCNISICQYMDAHRRYDEDTVAYEEEFLKEKKFIDDF